MRHTGRHVSLILFALAGLSMAHVGAYQLTFRCWSCHGDLTSATHAAFAGSCAFVLGVLALIVTSVARRSVRTSGGGVSASRLVVAEVAGFVILGLLEQRASLSHPLTDPTVILELALLFVTGVLLARFARIVEDVVGTQRANRSPGRRMSNPCPPCPEALSGRPRVTAYNATGFLRAPPLPA